MKCKHSDKKSKQVLANQIFFVGGFQKTTTSESGRREELQIGGGIVLKTIDNNGSNQCW